ncbi:ABC transporter ATP-binding protein uup [Anaerohalosphaera lusitana]|uniref:ATP-binding protein Uup n=1 Tax=Anaerohalosphaera lusitana TaxID=1936003 RepID=A0A1U9NPH5_9BACT|nr:ATP-binding cassette domain-containing protein [Anaerohalosphaera lusitana]AQT69510.1 ABC transporter ATP-binding protein uup [Anaerohalosphaera lusitana]
MALLTLQNVSIGFGGPNILDDITLHVEQGERLCLLGRNGAGKSTLLKLINGTIKPTQGAIQLEPGTKVAMLSQEVTGEGSHSVFDEVLIGLGELGHLLAEYELITSQVAHDPSAENMSRLEKAQHKVDTNNAWSIHRQVQTVLTHLDLNGSDTFGSLSAGTKRRVEMAKALITKPDILLLDEPTNHLDINSITWLEGFLNDYPGTIVFVTHDRSLIRNLSTRIIDVELGTISSWSCDYDTFTQRKEQHTNALLKHRAEFDKKLAEEEQWIRQGVRERRKRNQGRVRELQEMREQRRNRRQLAAKANIETQQADLSGRLVIETFKASFQYDHNPPIVDDLSTTILRGDKVGIIGPNGCGKTTLLRLLLGQLSPTSGRVKLGTNLQIAYFDQLHRQLDPDKAVWQNVIDGYETVEFNGRKRHVIGYLQDFLFMPEQSKKPVRTLSGGERNRLLLAQLFAKPTNLLVLDEPTNDLDMETLELLEELLVNFQGTFLLVSHDREFLNNVVTSTLVFEGGGMVKEYAGGYDDWLKQRKPLPQDETSRPAKPEKKQKKSKPKPAQKKKLSYREKQELEQLPARIEELESEQAGLHEDMAKPDFYKQDSEKISAVMNRSEKLDSKLAELYERWEQLEELNT